MAGVRGKVVIVTGAASGQGAAEAKLFAAEGAKVVVTDINEAGRDIAAGLGALFVRHDVGEKTSWAEVITNTLDRHGRLDVLVNNAGAIFCRLRQNSRLTLITRHWFTWDS